MAALPTFLTELTSRPDDIMSFFGEMGETESWLSKVLQLYTEGPKLGSAGWEEYTSPEAKNLKNSYVRADNCQAVLRNLDHGRGAAAQYSLTLPQFRVIRGATFDLFQNEKVCHLIPRK